MCTGASFIHIAHVKINCMVCIMKARMGRGTQLIGHAACMLVKLSSRRQGRSHWRIQYLVCVCVHGEEGTVHQCIVPICVIQLYPVCSDIVVLMLT